jgi:hypothetical protein
MALVDFFNHAYVAQPPTMQVEWTIPRLPTTGASRGVNPQPLPPGGQVSAALPHEAMRLGLAATGSPLQPGTGGAWASAVQAFFAHGGGGGVGKVLELYRIEGES